MMKYSALLLIYAPLMAQAQSTITTVDDGDWYDPGIWSCGCIPADNANVTVAHYISTDGILKYGGSLLVEESGYIDAFYGATFGCPVELNGVLETFETLYIRSSSNVTIGVNGYCGSFYLLQEGGLLVEGMMNVIDSCRISGPVSVEVGGDLSCGVYEASIPALNNGNLYLSEYVTGKLTNYGDLTIDGEADGFHHVINHGELWTGIMQFDTLSNTGSLTTAGATITGTYSGSGSWFVTPSGQDIDIADGAVLSIMAPGAIRVSNGDLNNNGIVQGNGCIEVAHVTNNAGSINGNVNICDLSPTATVWPFLDINVGAVETGVSFCACSYEIFSEVGENLLEHGISIFPNPAVDHIAITMPDDGAGRIELIDASGRPVRVENIQGSARTDLRIDGLPAGIYLLRMIMARGTRIERLVIADR